MVSRQAPRLAELLGEAGHAVVPAETSHPAAARPDAGARGDG